MRGSTVPGTRGRKKYHDGNEIPILRDSTNLLVMTNYEGKSYCRALFMNDDLLNI